MSTREGAWRGFVYRAEVTDVARRELAFELGERLDVLYCSNAMNRLRLAQLGVLGMLAKCSSVNGIRWMD